MIRSGVAPALFMLLTLCILTGLQTGCAKKKDPREAVRALIKTCEDRANKGDQKAVIAAIAEDYQDVEGRDKAAVAKRVTRHMRRHSKRFVHARPLTIQVDGDTAQATLIVALAGRRIGAKDNLLKVSADLIKLKLELTRKDSVWRVKSAAWRRPSPLDVL